MNRQGPSRTCIGCRSERDKKELVRFVLSPEKKLVVDYNGKLPGRGCYTCPDRLCIESAIKKRAFQRAFRHNIDTGSPGELSLVMTEKAGEKVRALLSLAIRSRNVSRGAVAVEDDLKRQKAALVLILPGASGSSVKKWRAAAEKAGAMTCLLPEIKGIDKIVDRRKPVSVRNREMATVIVSELGRIKRLNPGNS